MKKSRGGPDDTFLTVRFPKATHRKLKRLAETNERTLSAEIRLAVRRHLEAA